MVMKRYLDELLGRQPVPSRSNGFFPLDPTPVSLLRCRKSRKTAAAKRPLIAKPPVSQR